MDCFSYMDLDELHICHACFVWTLLATPLLDSDSTLGSATSISVCGIMTVFCQPLDSLRLVFRRHLAYGV